MRGWSMDFKKLTLFEGIKRRVDWLNQRQKVLSENIANADTPKYRARDLKEIKFRDALNDSVDRVNIRTTDPKHISKGRAGAGANREGPERKPYETAPAGNAVVLEEQVMKVSDTTVNHKLMTELYKKHLGMLRTATGRR
ncbi:MAG: flagellar basal body protein [Rhodospirillales bacterium]|nr:flagellar basal body protein [Rhodospirillales bacterium]